MTTYSSNLKDEKAQGERNPFRYRDYARAYLEERATIYNKGQTYTYKGTHYEIETDLDKRVRRWLMANEIPESNGLVSNVVETVKAFALCDGDLPQWRNGRHEGRTFLPFTNGLLDLDAYMADSRIEMLDHTCEYRCTFSLPFAFESAASCPMFMRFLSQALGDEEQVRLMQEWFGYCISGDTSQQKFAVNIGPPGAGKGTLAEILIELLGASNVTAYDLRRLISPFGVSTLVGKALAVVGEVELSAVKEKAAILEKLKSITGEDRQVIEYKHNPATYTMRLPTRFHVLANSMPDLRDASTAIVRRMLVFRFDRAVPEAERNTDLKATLRTELPGIALWALEGLRRLRDQKRFSMTARMTAELDEVRQNCSPPLGFLRDACVVNHKLDTGALAGVELTDEPVWVAREQFHETARHWCHDLGVQYSEVWFVRDLKTILPKLPNNSRRRNQHGNQFRTYEGIGIKVPKNT